MCFPILRKCCCIIPLRAGVMMAALFEIVFCTLNLVAMALYETEPKIVHEDYIDAVLGD